MIKSLANTIGDRINQFDDLDLQTAATFNSLFPECQLRDNGLDDVVSIGSPGSNNTRHLVVNGVEVKHKMFSDILYTVDKDGGVDETNLELDEINGVPV